MKLALGFLLAMFLLLNIVGKLAEVPNPHQLEPLPSLETPPNYGGHEFEFDHL